MARKFDDLRKRTVEPEQGGGPESFEARMQRLLTSPDGQSLCAWLEAQMQAPSHPNASAEALREAEGARHAYRRILEMTVR